MPASASSPRCARCAPSSSCGTRSPATATASSDAKLRRFRYGVQVNSLGLDRAAAGEQRLSHPARDPGGHALEEAPGRAPSSCRPGTRRWACRGPGTSNGRCACSRSWRSRPTCWSTTTCSTASQSVAAKVDELKAEARAELARIDAMGGALAAVEIGLHEEPPGRERRHPLRRIAAGAQKVVGVNCYTETAPSPLTTGDDGGVPDRRSRGRGGADRAPRRRIGRRATRRPWPRALAELERAAREGRNVMPASIACAHAGVTTGEWAECLRAVFGEYRAPTGVAGADDGSRCATRWPPVRDQVDALARRLGRRLKMLVGKPGLDGHSNGAEQIAVAARDCGIEVVYEGIRLSPARIVGARSRKASMWSVSRSSRARTCRWCRRCCERMRDDGIGDVPVVVGGIIPPDDMKALLAMPASPGSTRPRISPSTRSWTTSSRSWPPRRVRLRSGAKMDRK